MDPITLTALALRAGTELSEHSSLIIAAGQVIYKLMTAESEPRPIKNYKIDQNYQDRRRYNDLCNLRRPLSPDGKIPKQWELDEKHCPTYQIEFIENATQFKQHVEALDICSYPEKTAVSGMVEIIENVFVSMALKKAEWKSKLNVGWYDWKNYRNDSYEVMFFADLAIWLSITLPRYNIKDADTEVLIQQWITYCQEVHDTVLKYRDDNRSATSPKQYLATLIVALEKLHKTICKANQAATFTDKIEQVNVGLVNMAKHAFSFLYLLIEVDKNPVIAHSGVNIEQILAHKSPSKTTKIDANVSKVVSSMMGGWIAETFRIAGINSCDFINGKEIDIELVSEHISTDFSKIQQLCFTGLWKFARRDRLRAEGYLEHIAEINRLILGLYYARDINLIGLFLGREEGNTWAYGEHRGKESVDVLLKVLDDAIKKLDDAIAGFWQQFYTNDYLVVHNTHDNTNICNQHMNEGKDIVAKINWDRVSLRKKITEIEIKSSEHVKNSELTDKEFRRFNAKLYAYVIQKGLNIEANLISAISNYGTTSSRPSRVYERIQYVTVGNDLTAESTAVLDYAKEELPVYSATVALYSKYKHPLRVNFSPPENLEPTDFHSVTQRRIYKGILLRYNAAVTNWEYFSYWHGISVYKIVEFKKLYAFMNAVMRKLYSGTKEAWPKITKLEAALIDSALIKALEEYFVQDENFSSDFQLQEEPLEGSIANGRITVKLSRTWQEVAVDALAEELRSLTAVLNEREALGEKIDKLNTIIKELTTERDALRLQLADKDAIIAEKDGVIVELKGVVTEKDGVIAELKGIISDKDGIITAMDNKTNEMSVTIEAQKTQLTPPEQQTGVALKTSSGRDSFKKVRSIGTKISTHGFAFLGRSTKSKVGGTASASALSEDAQIESVANFY